MAILTRKWEGLNLKATRSCFWVNEETNKSMYVEEVLAQKNINGIIPNLHDLE